MPLAGIVAVARSIVALVLVKACKVVPLVAGMECKVAALAGVYRVVIVAAVEACKVVPSVVVVAVALEKAAAPMNIHNRGRYSPRRATVHC